MPERAPPTVWLRALLPLLLAAALTIPFLDADSFHGDEPATLLAAGILQPETHSLAATWRFIAENDPHQAHGWPLLLFVWGRLVGWSLVAVRALPLFAGLLTLAWVYRCGRDFFSPVAGLTASLLLAASLFFLAYLTHARAFSLVALCVALVLWCYWRLTFQPRPPTHLARVGLLAGCVGLLYAHYFSALFLPVLIIFHLPRRPRDRRWQQTAALFVLAALLALPQLPGFFNGLQRTTGDHALGGRALAAPDMLARLAYRLSNGVIPPAEWLGATLIVLLPLLFLVLTLRRRGAGASPDARWMLLFTAAGFLLVAVAVNEVVGTLLDDRLRYLMPLLPPCVLLAAAGLRRLTGHGRALPSLLVALWVALGAFLGLATDFRYELGFFFPTDIHRVFDHLALEARRGDLLVLDDHVAGGYSIQLHTGLLGIPSRVIHRRWEDPILRVRTSHAEYRDLWLLYRSEDRGRFSDLPEQLGRALCERSLDRWGFSLDRLAPGRQDCGHADPRLEFDAGLLLSAPWISLHDGILQVKIGAHSPDRDLPARYSLALHVIDPDSGERLAQDDSGLGQGVYIPVLREIDVSALPPGNYELHLALYDWQTGERLIARDLQTGAVRDIHVMQHVGVD
ncbi:MAG: glycosyltransferase family 39 protein [Anaerolineaceae bacterium]|nr:glycosyltransferase family 39 protein [Anaerolineaceae bacterium]